MKLRCKTCNKMKYDTAFEINWWSLSLKTNKCLDCKYPHRWDEVHKHFRKIAKEQENNK